MVNILAHSEEVPDNKDKKDKLNEADNLVPSVDQEYWGRFVVVDHNGQVVAHAETEEKIRKSFGNLPTAPQAEALDYKIYQVTSDGKIIRIKGGFSHTEIKKILNS